VIDGADRSHALLHSRSVTTDPPLVKRTVLDAILLALVTPGTGYLYVGRPRAAIVTALAVVVGLQLAIAVVVLLDLDLLWGSVGVMLAVTLVQVFALLDSARSARAIGDGYRLRRYNRTGIYLLWIAVVCAVLEATSIARKVYLVEAFKAPTGSMAPAVEAGDNFIATKLSRDREARRGDIVVFRYPGDPREIFFKRVLGVGGDELRFFDDHVEVNGHALARTPCRQQAAKGQRCFMETDADGNTYAIQEPTYDLGDRQEWSPTTLVVPPGHVFVVGDSRRQSHDSLQWGPLPLDAVIGRARVIWLPFARAGEIDRPR
jgi:signal peptidase I